MPICAAGCQHSLFTFKKWCGLWHSAQMRTRWPLTTPTTTRKICAFFFTGLDWSRLTNLDQSRSIWIWLRKRPLLNHWHTPVQSDPCGSLPHAAWDPYRGFMDVSPLWRFAPSRGRFAPWTIRPLDDSPPGRFAHMRWTIRPQNSSTHWKLSCRVYFCGYATRVLKSVSRLTTI